MEPIVTSKIKVLLMIGLCSGSLDSAPSNAEEIPACAGVTDIKSKSRPLFSGDADSKPWTGNFYVY